MLTISIPERELFDENSGVFINLKAQVLQLEHSLVSISKWESKWHKPFLTNGPKTPEEMVDYVRCMTITQNVNQQVYSCLSGRNWQDIRNYIDDPMTATTFGGGDRRKNRGQIVTSELIYYWMVSLGIPFECQKWHINRLLTLIHVCDVKNQPAKKASRKDIYARNRALNAARRAKTGSRG